MLPILNQSNELKMKILIITAILLLASFASCLRATTTPQQSTEESYTTVGNYSYFCNNYCDTYKNQMCSPPGDTATDFQFEILSGDLSTPQTSNGYQFKLAGHEAVYLEFKCPPLGSGTACSGNGPKSIEFDKNGHVDCSVTSKSNNPNDEHKTLYCKNKSSDSHHHLNILSFGCGAYYAF
ncbi:hypothetical protein ACFODZ_07380 [Marinicella sediminis]|uniref:Uncharacterized protein n=2 Tax=Marinicella sediminis TaxID=1792834 RepID=A0ABV7J7G9_9GAMM